MTAGPDSAGAAGATATPSATVPDWSREAKPLWAWDPSRSLLASLRAHQRRRGSGRLLDVVLRKVAVARHRFWSVVTGADIPIGCVIGGGLVMPHPNGVVIHCDAVVGPNCLIFQQVTLAAGPAGAPRIGGHVDIGAGAKILGAVTIGDNALIGANAVVVGDVPAGATAVGVPARVIGAASVSPEPR